MQHDGHKDDELNAGLGRGGGGPKRHAVSWKPEEETDSHFGGFLRTQVSSGGMFVPPHEGGAVLLY